MIIPSRRARAELPRFVVVTGAGTPGQHAHYSGFDTATADAVAAHLRDRGVTDVSVITVDPLDRPDRT